MYNMLNNIKYIKYDLEAKESFNEKINSEKQNKGSVK